MESIAALQTASYKNSTCLGLSVTSSLVSLVKDSQALPRNYSDIVNQLATSFVRDLITFPGLFWTRRTMTQWFYSTVDLRV